MRKVSTPPSHQVVPGARAPVPGVRFDRGVTPDRDELLAAARAVAAEDEDRAGVAMLVALVDRTRPAPDVVPGPADAQLAAEVQQAWEVLRAADPDTTVQDALAALAHLRLRPPPGDEPGRGSPAPLTALEEGDGAPPAARGRGGEAASLAAWRPGDTDRPDAAARDTEAGAWSTRCCTGGTCAS